MKNFGIATISMIILLCAGGCNEQKTANIDKLNKGEPLKPENGEFRDPGQRCRNDVGDGALAKIEGDWTQDLGASSGFPLWTEDTVYISYSNCQYASWTRSGANSAAGYWYPRGPDIVLETLTGKPFDVWRDVRLEGLDSFRFQTQSGGEVVMRRMEKGEELPVAQ